MSIARFSRLLQLGLVATCCSQIQRRVQATIIFFCCLFMTICGRQVSADIIIDSVETNGSAHALGVFFDEWNESTFGGFSAAASGMSGDEFFSADACANNAFDGISTFDMSGTASSFLSTNNFATGANTSSTITFTIDSEYDYSFTGSQSGPGSNVAVFMLAGGPPQTTRFHGASGTISAGSYEIIGFAGTTQSVGEFTTSYTSRLTLTSVVPVLLGDVNLDGVVNLLDVSPFVTLLSTGTFQAEADINQDGIVNLLDVEPFVVLLSGG